MLNAYLVNDAEINGWREVYADSGVAQVSINSDGTLAIGNALSGKGQVVTQSTLFPGVIKPLSGTATITTQGALEPQVRRPVIGDAVIEVRASGDSGIIPAASGTATIQLEATGEAYTTNVVPLSSSGYYQQARIRLLGRLDPHIAKAPTLAGRAVIGTRSSLAANMMHNSPSGSAIVRTVAKGDIRKGLRLYGSGRANVYLSSRLRLAIQHRKTLSGLVEIRLRLTENRAGKPPIPTIFSPAHPSCQFTVGPGITAFTVPRENYL